MCACNIHAKHMIQFEVIVDLCGAYVGEEMAG
jgi:hypothetical protein